MEIEHISRDAIEELLDQPPTAPAVTLYIPMHRSASPPHMTEDQIRFKNMVHRAIEILGRRDDGRDMEHVLSAWLVEVQNDKDFWEHQTEGLLICARPGEVHMFHLPIDTEEYVAVDTMFHLAPIFGLLHDSRDYYLLVLAQHQPILYSGDEHNLQESGISLPESLMSGLNIDEMGQRNERPQSAMGNSVHPSIFNGRGGDKNPAEEERQRFWRMLDQIICNKADTKLPLILAGVDSEAVEYKSISHYPHVLETTISGNFTSASPQELLQLVSEVVRDELIESAHREVREEYERLKGQDPARVARDFAAAQDAADKGRVAKLLIGMSRRTTDTVRDNLKPVLLLSFPKPAASSQAINGLAERVWNQSGDVINLTEDSMPDNIAPLVAIMRY